MKVFSIMITDRSINVTLFEERIQKIKKGLQQLLSPVLSIEQIDLFKSVCDQRKEWVEVHVKEARQLSLLDDLEASLGSNLTSLDILSEVANQRVRTAVTTIARLRLKRIWHAHEFLELLGLEDASKAARQMGCTQGTLEIRTVDGLHTSTPLPHRRFSALQDIPVDLEFRPLTVGHERAIVYLSKVSQRKVGAKTRRVEVSWHDTNNSGTSTLLFKAAIQQVWLIRSCRVIVNADGRPKALLLGSSRDQPPP